MHMNKRGKSKQKSDNIQNLEEGLFYEFDKEFKKVTIGSISWGGGGAHTQNHWKGDEKTIEENFKKW